MAGREGPREDKRFVKSENGTPRLVRHDEPSPSSTNKQHDGATRVVIVQPRAISPLSPDVTGV